jgi:hypothetical protein
VSAVRQPCKSCPWRVDQDASDIPNFSLELAEGLARTCDGQFGSPQMACHQSRDGDEFVCAGWLARHGYDSIAVRLQLIAGKLSPEALEPSDDWPELHADFGEMIEKLRVSS